MARRLQTAWGKPGPASTLPRLRPKLGPNFSLTIGAHFRWAITSRHSLKSCPKLVAFGADSTSPAHNRIRSGFGQHGQEHQPIRGADDRIWDGEGGRADGLRHAMRGRSGGGRQEASWPVLTTLLTTPFVACASAFHRSNLQRGPRVFGSPSINSIVSRCASCTVSREHLRYERIPFSLRKATPGTDSDESRPVCVAQRNRAVLVCPKSRGTVWGSDPRKAHEHATDGVHEKSCISTPAYQPSPPFGLLWSCNKPDSHSIYVDIRPAPQDLKQAYWKHE